MNKKILTLIAVTGISAMLLLWSVAPAVSAINVSKLPFTLFEDGFTNKGCKELACPITHVIIALDVDRDGNCEDSDPHITLPIDTVDIPSLDECRQALP